MTYSWTTTNSNSNLEKTTEQKKEVMYNIKESNPDIIDSFLSQIDSGYVLDPKFFTSYEDFVAIKIFDNIIKTSLKISKDKSTSIYPDLSYIEKIEDNFVFSYKKTQKNLVKILCLEYDKILHTNDVIINQMPLYTNYKNYIGIVYIPHKSIVVSDRVCYINLEGGILTRKIDSYNDLIDIIIKENLKYDGIFNEYYLY